MNRQMPLITLCVVALTFVMATNAQDPPGKKSDPSAQIREEVTLREQILSRQFAEFQQSLLRLKQKLERSQSKDDRERAKILDRVLQKAKDELVGTQFSQLVDFLREQQFSNLGDIKKAVDRSKELSEDLRMLLALLREDTRAAQLRDERLKLEDLVKKIDEAIRIQKAVQGQTDLNKTEKNELQNLQNKATQKTAELARAIAGDKGDNLKGEPKGAGKDSGKSGKSKDAGETPKSAESKDPGKGEGDKAEAKGDKAGDPKKDDKGAESGEAKSGKNAQGSDSKQSGAKDSKSGDPSQKGDAKANPSSDKGDKKEGQAKESGGQEGAKIKTKKKEEEPGADKNEPKADAKGQQGSQSKQGQAKKADGKQQSGSKDSGQQKQGEAKPGEKSDGQSQAKSGQQQQQQAGPKDQQQQKPSAQKPQDDVANSKKQVEDANYKQQQAEEKIAKDDNKGASDKQGEAIQDLEKAKKKLEELLRQIREEEVERILAALQARCERMLAMQLQVLHGTEQVDKGINANLDKKPSRKNEQDSLKLSDDEKEIVREADKAIEILEAEGTAVAFPEVFQQVREDMKHVQRRLGVVDVGTVTQAIEKDIIDTLNEMIAALKKARDENKQQSGQPKQGEQSPNADQKLLEQIAELKMIRSMQIRVNTRTETYGRQYEGEQAFTEPIRGELQNLADRQERIVIVTGQIAKGDNR